MRRVVAWSAAILLVVAAAVYVLLEVVYDDSATPVAVAEVVDSFRETLAGAQGDGPGRGSLPRLGVYTYDTTGQEAVDALGGTTHTYPGTTPMSVRASGCGVAVRWDALEERFEDWEMCDLDGALVTTRFATFHEFFGQSDRRDFTCGEPLVLVPAEPSVGQTWTGVCSEEGFDEVFTATVEAIGPVDVGGEPTEAVHVHLDMTIRSPDGDPTGGTVSDLWFAASDRTILAWHETTATTAGSFVGPVTLDETFQLSLTDLEPRG